MPDPLEIGIPHPGDVLLGLEDADVPVIHVNDRAG